MPQPPRRARSFARVLSRTARSLVVLALVAFGLARGGSKTASSLPGQIPNAPAYLAGFPIPFYRSADYRPLEGSVVAADLRRDGHMALVVSIPNGLVTVVRADGSQAPGWPRTFDGLPQPAYPIGALGVGDLDGDGSLDIVTCVVSGGAARRNFLYAFRADGSLLPGWPVEILSTGDAFYSCSQAGTLLADLDGDGRMEVIRGMNEDEVQAFGGDGTALPGWPVRLGPDSSGRLRAINADLAAADLDGDGHPEVIFVESGLTPRLAAVDGRGRMMPGFPILLPEVVDQQAPVAADLDGDGRPELVQATLPFLGTIPGSPLSQASVAPAPDVPAALHVLRGDGSSLPGWPRTLAVGAPWGAVLDDLTGDGRPEILQQDGDQLFGYDLSGQVLAGFPYPLHRDFLRSGAIRISPWQVADLDGDGRRDLLQVRSDVYSGAVTMRVFALQATGRRVKGFPFDVPGFMAASRPAVADLSSDGVADLAILASQGTNGAYSLLAWDLGSLLPGAASSGRQSAGPAFPNRSGPASRGPGQPISLPRR